MKILIAEDDSASRRKLEFTLAKWGWQVIATVNGREALEVLETEDPPSLAVLDVMMPDLDGIEVCRRIRQRPTSVPPYLILLTAKTAKEDVVRGLEAGANDYVTKPFDDDELRARIRVGFQMFDLQQKLSERVRELEQAVAHIGELQGMLPICSYCKSIRDDQNYWQRVESYISEHSRVEFSHGICPDCYERVVQPQIDEMNRRKEREADV